MDDLKQQWREITLKLKALFNKKKRPDLNAVLMLIGINELGRTQSDYTKEQKQDLMHVAVCSLLSRSGYYELEGVDADGWPHFRVVKTLPTMPMEEQENLLKQHIIDYFADKF